MDTHDLRALRALIDARPDTRAEKRRRKAAASREPKQIPKPKLPENWFQELLADCAVFDTPKSPDRGLDEIANQPRPSTKLTRPSFDAPRPKAFALKDHVTVDVPLALELQQRAQARALDYARAPRSALYD